MYWPLPNTLLALRLRQTRRRRIFNISLVARCSAWRVKHHRDSTPQMRQPEPWSPMRW